MSQSRISTRGRYFWRSAVNRLRPARCCCPDCGCARFELVYRKALVTELRRCDNCELLYRAPTDPPGLDERFYQTEYRSGLTTDCPSDEELAKLIESKFRGSPKDFESRIQLLDALGATPGQHRILDFGASWGYGTWQFEQRGFDTIGLEVSRSRTRFGREKLGVDLRVSVEEIVEPIDVFFSSHVIEHFSQPSLAIQQARKLLRPGGLFIAYTPNGCEEFMRVNPGSYHRSWGGVHPSYLDDRYWRRMFPDAWHFFASTPVDLDCAGKWNQQCNCSLNLESSELVFAAKLKERDSGAPAPAELGRTDGRDLPRSKMWLEDQ